MTHAATASTDFQQAFNRLELLIEQRYGVQVCISDVIDPNTGDFDGASIKVDYDQDLELAVFVLVHLFGHTVQGRSVARCAQPVRARHKSAIRQGLAAERQQPPGYSAGR